MTDDELREISAEFRAGILSGGSADSMCFAVSAPLAGLLGAYGLDCDLVASDHSENPNSQWYEHYWIRLPDGRALDPTFDQFGGPAIYLGPPTEFHATREPADG